MESSRDTVVLSPMKISDFAQQLTGGETIVGKAWMKGISLDKGLSGGSLSCTSGEWRADGSQSGSFMRMLDRLVIDSEIQLQS